MDKTVINPPTLPRPRGFSHGILVTGGRLLFLAGQTGSDATGSIVAPGDLVAQYEQTLRNLKTVVEAAGGKMHDIAQITIFIRDRDDYLSHLKPLGQVHLVPFSVTTTRPPPYSRFRAFSRMKPLSRSRA